MKKISFLILSVIFILGSNSDNPRSVSIPIINHECIEDTTRAGEDYSGIMVDVKVMLAGPLDEVTGYMKTNLYKNDYLPTKTKDTNFFTTYHPKQLKWVDFNKNCLDSIIPVSEEFVDFVQVILVEGDPYRPDKLHWRLARLDSTGNVRSFDNKKDYLKFYLPENKDFYVIVVHRNHNAIMSSIPIRGSFNQITTYDFTEDIYKIWDGYWGVVQIANKICMIPGDGAGAIQNGWDFGKGDNYTDMADFFAAKNGRIKGDKKYSDTDHDLDGRVSQADIDIAALYWGTGSRVPFCISNGLPWSENIRRKDIDYNMDHEINSLDTPHREEAEKDRWKFPSKLDFNRDGKFDILDRRHAHSLITDWPEQEASQLIIPSYRLNGKITQVSSDSLAADINLLATGVLFEYVGSQYIIKVDTSQFRPMSVNISGNLTYNLNIAPSGIISISATVPNNGIIVISDTGSGTEIAKVVIKGQRRGSGNSQELITWRNGPENPFTKIFAFYAGSNVNITNPENHFFLNTTTGTETGNSQTILPKDFKLTQNYPNPFNPNTDIKFSIPQKTMVKIKVFDITGKEVATLVNEVKTAGYYPVAFNASNLPSGAYFYRLEAGSFIETKKMLLIK